LWARITRSEGAVTDNPHFVPTLDEIAANPARADVLSVEVVKRLLIRHAAVGELLLGRLIAAPTVEPKPNGTDRFLDAGEVGAMIGKSKSWVEKKTEALPKRKKVGGKGMWSEREIQTWMKHRETWD
jgi:predicted DNA-binding transcriptional regulator AlpA